MADCNTCEHKGTNTHYCDECSSDYDMFERKIVTNADKIRAMNDEELAEFLEGVNRDYDISYGDYFSTEAGDFIFSKKDLAKEILSWLQSEAE